jgi:hypothetical protein
MRSNILSPESDQSQPGDNKSLFKGRYLNIEGLRSRSILFIYLLIGIAGLTGSIFIIIKVINLPSVSDFNMVLLFGVACTFLAVMHTGFHGFYELMRENK